MFCEGFQHFPGFFQADEQSALVSDIACVLDQAPLFKPVMPRTGKPFSVEMSNAGCLGWVSDINGYRYQPTHPVTGSPWAPIPRRMLDLWNELVDWPDLPEACLINVYRDGAKMGSHRDSDEDAKDAPVISVSLGDTARFHVGGPRRANPKQRVNLQSGDVVVLAGAARQVYHGIDKVMAGTSDILDDLFLGGGRINLTLRRVTI
ncbi:MAG: alpha-ketoglutarate-dependent dioxygenase AlkB family protein [Hyphomicrobiaceae bacterium]